MTIFVMVASGIVAGVIALLIIVNRHTRTVHDVLARLAAAAGWSDLRRAFMAAAGVKGVWRAFPVELVYRARQKGVPQRIVTKVHARSDEVLILKRRFNGFLSNRPLTWFGPPLLELRYPLASELWVRGDGALAERMFNDNRIADQLRTNLVARYDEIRIDKNGLKITRSIDERIVRERYGIPAFAMRFEPRHYETIAREELQLAEAMVNLLSAR